MHIPNPLAWGFHRRFGHAGPFWGREYIFWHSGQPLTLIHEIFSPALEKYLGPMNA